MFRWMTRHMNWLALILVALAFTGSRLMAQGPEASGGTRLDMAAILQMIEPTVVIVGPSFVLALLTRGFTWVRGWSTGAKRGFVIGGSIVLGLLFLRGQGTLGMDTVGQLLAAISGALGGLTATATVAVVKSEERTA